MVLQNGRRWRRLAAAVELRSNGQPMAAVPTCVSQGLQRIALLIHKLDA
jgi:hypothetical protein